MTSHYIHNDKNGFLKGAKINPNNKPIIQLDVDIVLGRPKDDCHYLGICKIEPERGFHLPARAPALNRVKAKIHCYSPKELTFYFEIKSMAECTIQKHFSYQFFTIQESINVSEFVARAIKTSFSIEAGQYPIFIGKDYYKVVFENALLSKA